MRTRQALAVLAVALLVVTAGCAGIGEDAGDREAMDAEDGASADGGAPAEADDSVSEDSSGAADRDANVADRQLIRTAELHLEVDDAEAAGDELREQTADLDGFVGDSSRQTHEAHNETWRTARIVVRVPTDSFDEAVVAFETLGQLERAETTTEDVTDELVDLEARLENLEAERDRLRTLYDRANETEDVLAVQRELSSTQEEIERLEARQQALQDSVAYATITVHLAEEEPEPEPTPEEAAWYDTAVTAAFMESLEGVAVTLRAMVVAAAYATPYALVFGTPFVAAAGVYWYRAG